MYTDFSKVLWKFNYWILFILNRVPYLERFLMHEFGLFCLLTQVWWREQSIKEAHHNFRTTKCDKQPPLLLESQILLGERWTILLQATLPSVTPSSNFYTIPELLKGLLDAFFIFLKPPPPIEIFKLIHLLWKMQRIWKFIRRSRWSISFQTHWVNHCQVAEINPLVRSIFKFFFN